MEVVKMDMWAMAAGATEAMRANVASEFTMAKAGCESKRKKRKKGG